MTFKLNIVWESRDKINPPNFYAHCLYEYLSYRNWLFQMCTIGFVNTTILLPNYEAIQRDPSYGIWNK